MARPTGAHVVRLGRRLPRVPWPSPRFLAGWFVERRRWRGLEVVARHPGNRNAAVGQDDRRAINRRSTTAPGYRTHVLIPSAHLLAGVQHGGSTSPPRVPVRAGARARGRARGASATARPARRRDRRGGPARGRGEPGCHRARGAAGAAARRGGRLVPGARRARAAPGARAARRRAAGRGSRHGQPAGRGGDPRRGVRRPPRPRGPVPARRRYPAGAAGRRSTCARCAAGAGRQPLHGARGGIRRRAGGVAAGRRRRGPRLAGAATDRAATAGDRRAEPAGYPRINEPAGYPRVDQPAGYPRVDQPAGYPRHR